MVPETFLLLCIEAKQIFPGTHQKHERRAWIKLSLIDLEINSALKK